MITNCVCVQYVKSDELALSLFLHLSKTSDPRIGVVELSDGAKVGPAGTFTYYSLKKQAEFLGLTPCVEFEGFTLVYDCGDIMLAKAQPKYASDGSVSLYSTVEF